MNHPFSDGREGERWPLLEGGAVQRMKDLQQYGDPEGAHSQADDLLCEVLIALGERDLVEEWRKVPKWYA